MAKINTYEEFEREVQHIGFLPYFGLDDKTLFSLEAMTDNAWYDDAPDDPWRWRVRAAEEGKMAYGTFFLKKKGFIWQEMLPAMIAVRRENRIFEEFFTTIGLISPGGANLEVLLAQTDQKAGSGLWKGRKFGVWQRADRIADENADLHFRADAADQPEGRALRLAAEPVLPHRRALPPG